MARGIASVLSVLSILSAGCLIRAGGGGSGGDDDGGELPSPGTFPGGGGEGEGEGPGDLDTGIPAEYPQLSARYSSHGLWAIDHSGAAVVPNEWVASVDQLAEAEGVQTYGAIWDSGYLSFRISMADTEADEQIEIYLPALDPGEYDVTGFDGEMVYTERVSYRYTTAIAGGYGTVRIEENNGVALWGTFEGRFCFVETPEANCYRLYEGRFAALDQSPEE